eukprot:2128595-Prymnesium_polylepis.1
MPYLSHTCARPHLGHPHHIHMSHPHTTGYGVGVPNAPGGRIVAFSLCPAAPTMQISVRTKVQALDGIVSHGGRSVPAGSTDDSSSHRAPDCLTSGELTLGRRTRRMATAPSCAQCKS